MCIREISRSRTPSKKSSRLEEDMYINNNCDNFRKAALLLQTFRLSLTNLSHICFVSISKPRLKLSPFSSAPCSHLQCQSKPATYNKLSWCFETQL